MCESIESESESEPRDTGRRFEGDGARNPEDNDDDDGWEDGLIGDAGGRFAGSGLAKPGGMASGLFTPGGGAWGLFAPGGGASGLPTPGRIASGFLTSGNGLAGSGKALFAPGGAGSGFSDHACTLLWLRLDDLFRKTGAVADAGAGTTAEAGDRGRSTGVEAE